MEVTEKIDLTQFEALLKSELALLVYFYQEKCGVCTGLFPKVRDMVRSEFPEMELLVLEAHQNRELAAQLRMMSVPGILVYFEGKEFFRTNGLVAMIELNTKISRYYNLMFD
ncbi:thioredoxin family protein [Aquiflexum gelatinilyticum]|uniref:Thioredoxin family protein n=1 Tax=Aquiflexum gelatinilyticum TaxID=2961943 RepID=A0A9X2P8R6_9BACT|nr:thioredoxin family protein [Aquiflexum gelatinilyticum]MCR9016408.1 thioredoxin family protein [Aquiflexum gelatinilyticum]